SRMKKIKVRSWNWQWNLAAHTIASFEQRPIKGFAVERNEHRMFCYSFPQCGQQRAFLAVFAHEELLDLQPATFPPCNTNEKSICPAPARKAGGLCIQKKPLVGVCDFVHRVRHEQFQRAGIGRMSRWLSTPASNRQIVSVLVGLH